MSWSKGLGYMVVLQRAELADDPELEQIMKLTTLAGGLQDLWLSITRRKPVLLETPLSSRPDDERTVAQLIMDRMDKMGRTCDAYLDREITAEELRKGIREHRRLTKALVAEIKVEDMGPEDA
jgi:hypothetical protein